MAFLRYVLSVPIYVFCVPSSVQNFTGKATFLKCAFPFLGLQSSLNSVYFNDIKHSQKHMRIVLSLALNE